jgi:hypothetical protein
MENEHLFLVHFQIDQAADLPALDLQGDGRAIAEGLYLIHSELSQSRLYHRIKWQLPDDTPLIVATLNQAPKFKGMAKGSLKWLRER